MGITRGATLRGDVACRWEWTATQYGSYRSVTLHRVMRSVVLFIMAISFTWPAHSIGGNLS